MLLEVVSLSGCGSLKINKAFKYPTVCSLGFRIDNFMAAARPHYSQQH